MRDWQIVTELVASVGCNIGDRTNETVARAYRVLVLALMTGPLLASWLPGVAQGHEIPSDVTVRMIVRPRADRLDVLVRAPLEAMQDIDFPTFGPGYLDAARADQSLRNAALLWLANDLLLYEGERPLGRPALVAVRASIPSDRSFASIDTALAHVHGPGLAPGTELVWQQALLDVLFELPIQSQDSTFALEPTLDRLGLNVTIAVQFVAADGTARVFELSGRPGRVILDPRWHHAFARFLGQGFGHILDGRDHLLFLLCLVLPLRRSLKGLIWTVTAFTLAHSTTLAASAFGLAPNGLWFPPLVETLIAASILYMALENMLTEHPRMRAGVAFGFGLIHGFGFSFALRNTMQFAGDHVLTSLLSFNLGVELGQILVLIAMVGVLNVLLRFSTQQRMIVLIISALVAHTAWHWLDERYAILSQYDIQWVRAEQPARPASLAHTMTPFAPAA